MKYWNAVITTLFALLLSMWLSSDINSDYITNMLCGVKDIEFSDFYDRIIYNKPEKDLNNDIVIVYIDSVNGRNEIAQVINDIVDSNAKVVGVDVLFEESHGVSEDSLLLDVISRNDHIILAREINSDTDKPYPSIFDGVIPNNRFGFVNLIKRNSQIVRTFYPSWEINKKTSLSFACAIIEKIDNNLYLKIKEREKEEEKIFFSPTAFYEIDGRYVKQYKKLISGKIVLIGCISEKLDSHITPVSNSMVGIEIWAHTLNDLINSHFLSPVGPVLDWIFAILCCLFLSFLYIRLDNTNLQNIGMRIVPIFIVIGLCFFGCFLYYYHIYLNVSKAILLSALGILSLDIYYAFSGWIKLKKRKV